MLFQYSLALLAAAASGAYGLTRCATTVLQTPVYASRDVNAICYFSAQTLTSTVPVECGGCTIATAYAGHGPTCAGQVTVPGTATYHKTACASTAAPEPTP